MAIITPADIATFLRLGTLNVDQAAAAQSIIDGLVGDLEAFLGRPATIRQFTETPRFPVTWSGAINLRNRPVRSILAVAANGVPITAYFLDGMGLAGVSLPPTSPWPPVVSVTYTAGLDGENIKDDFGRAVRGKLLRVAARSFAKIVKDDNIGVTSVSVEGYNVRYAGDVGNMNASVDGWTDGELWSLSRWKQRR